MDNHVRKAIFPVAGLGTRFLPATKANPKEMLPIVDKPLIQYAVEEAVKAGIKELIFVTSSAKRAIEDHFDSNFELECTLQERGKYELLNVVRDILPAGVSCVYIRQTNPLGLGHAVLCAKNLIGNEPFAVLLADDMIEDGKSGCLKQMIPIYEHTQSSVIGVDRIPHSQTHKYGIVAMKDQLEESGQIKNIVEKPAPENAPSNLAVVGRYILTPKIFSMLEMTSADMNGEIQLTDAISHLLREEAVYSHRIIGRRYDCGSKLGYLQATVSYALKHRELATEFRLYLQEIMKEEILDESVF